VCHQHNRAIRLSCSFGEREGSEREGRGGPKFFLHGSQGCYKLLDRDRSQVATFRSAGVPEQRASSAASCFSFFFSSHAFSFNIFGFTNRFSPIDFLVSRSQYFSMRCFRPREIKKPLPHKSFLVFEWSVLVL